MAQFAGISEHEIMQDSEADQSIICTIREREDSDPSSVLHVGPN